MHIDLVIERIKMLGVFSGLIMSPPEELVAADSRTPFPKATAEELVAKFLEENPTAISVRIGGDDAQMAYTTHHNHSTKQPRLFAVKDEIFCLFEGELDNLGILKQDYGLVRTATEALLMTEAYQALRDRAPYPPHLVVGHLQGDFAFVVFDKSTSTLFVAIGQSAKVPLYWGITADGYVAFGDDSGLLHAACGKSLAPFPQGCFLYTAVGGRLQSYKNPKCKITAVPAEDKEIFGAKYMVKDQAN